MANTDLGQMVFKITGDNSGLKRTLGESETAANKMGGTLAKLGIAAGIALAAAKVYEWSKAWVKASSAAAETGQKFGVVFSQMSEKANQAAKDLAAGYGMSNSAAKDLLGSTGNILQSMGYTQEAALKTSIQLSQLGADITSFSNYQGGAVEATRILTKAMLGERDALQSLDIKISEDDLKNYAAAQGKVVTQLNQREKAELTVALLMERTALAQGDMARSSSSYENVMRRVDSRMSDMSVMLGDELTPALGNLGTAFLEATKDGAPLLVLFQTVLKGAAMLIQGLANITNYVSMKSATKEFEKNTDTVRYAAKNIVANYKELTTTLGAEAGTSYSELDKMAAGYSGAQKARVDWLTSGIKEFQKQVKEGGAKTDDLAGKAKGAIITFNGEIDTKAASEAASERSKLRGGIQQATGDIKKAKTEAELWAETMNRVSQASTAVGNALSAAAQLTDAIYAKKIQQNEDEMNAVLKKNGLLEADSVSKAEADLAKANESGDAERIRIAKDALLKSQIEEKYAKKKRMLEFQAAEASWSFQMASAAAAAPLMIMNAWNSGIQAGPLAGIPLAATMAGIAAATAGIQLAAISVAKPEKPKFANGGIVPGNSFSGDNVPVQANSGEMVLNKEQQGRLFAQANGQGGGMMRVAPISKESILDVLFRASQNGELFISQRAVVSR